MGVFFLLKEKNPFVYELKLHDKFLFHIVIVTPNFLIKYANCELPHNYKAQKYNYVIKSFYETFVGKRAGWGDSCLARTRLVLPRGPLCLNCPWVTITSWLLAWISQVLSLRKPLSVMEGMATKPLCGGKGETSSWKKGFQGETGTSHNFLCGASVPWDCSQCPLPTRTHTTSPHHYLPTKRVLMTVVSQSFMKHNHKQ